MAGNQTACVPVVTTVLVEPHQAGRNEGSTLPDGGLIASTAHEEIQKALKESERKGKETECTPNQHVMKSKVVKTDCVEEVGEVWCIMRLLNWMTTLNLKAIDAIRRVPWLYIILLCRLVSLLIMLIIGITFLAIACTSAVAYALVGLYVLVQVLTLGLLTKAVCDACTIHFEQSCTFGLFLCFIILEIIVACMIPFVIPEKYATLTSLQLLAFLGINLFYELNMLLWLIVSPLMLLLAVFECIVRLLLLRFHCPQKKPLVLKCKYKLTPYKDCSQEEKMCPICREPFQPEDLLCQLRCNTTHMFHEACIFTALVKHPFCPLCRKPVNFV